MVTGGGLSKIGQWRCSRKKFLVPIKVLAKKFRGKFLALLQREKLEFFGEHRNLNSPSEFSALLQKLMHVLPTGFRKIRHYGLFASRDKGQRIKLCKRKFAARRETPGQRLERILGKDFNLCPCCKTGHLAREPPRCAN